MKTCIKRADGTKIELDPNDVIEVDPETGWPVVKRTVSEVTQLISRDDLSRGY